MNNVKINLSVPLNGFVVRNKLEIYYIRVGDNVIEVQVINIYIIKQDIRIYIHVAYNRPNGWTDWAEVFWGHSGVIRRCFRLKKNSTCNAGPFS